jgi:hypothetical protein
MAAQARMMDLFKEGAVAAVEVEGVLEPVAWVNKLNAFQKEDVERAARGARAKRILEWERNEDEQAILELDTSEWTDDMMVEAVLQRDSAQHYIEAVQELRTQEEWKDRLDYLGNVDVLGITQGEDVSEEDRALFENVNEEYAKAIQTINERIEAEAKADLVAKGREGIIAEYRKRYRETQGMQAFYAETRIAEVQISARECKGTWNPEMETWDHTRCGNHQVRLFPHRDSVKEIPDTVYFAITAVLEALNMSVDQAGNSDAPPASSESPEQPSAEADSSPSTPVETSTVPAGT